MLKNARTLFVGAMALCACATNAEAATIIFANPTAITIPDSGTASSYPSTIAVAGFTGGLTDLSLTLTGLSHTYTDDLDLLLVGPTGAALVFMSDAGGANGVLNVNLTFSDAAALLLPDATAIAAGTYRPSNWPLSSDGFPAPAPATSGSDTFANTFGGLDPNGVWSLYVRDDLGGDQGGISGGWSLTITAPTDSAPVPEPASLTLLGLGLAGMGARRWRQRKRS